MWVRCPSATTAVGEEALSLGRVAGIVDAASECGFAAISASDHFVFQTPWIDGPTAGADRQRGGPDAQHSLWKAPWSPGGPNAGTPGDARRSAAYHEGSSATGAAREARKGRTREARPGRRLAPAFVCGCGRRRVRGRRARRSSVAGVSGAGHETPASIGGHSRPRSFRTVTALSVEAARNNGRELRGLVSCLCGERAAWSCTRMDRFAGLRRSGGARRE
jgi:hypothetical protein